MNDNSRANMLKVGAAAAGGYVLGRTKKGKAGLSLALWAAGGNKYTAGNLLRSGLIRLVRTPQAQAMIGELRETVVHAGQQAVTGAVQARASAMTDALQRRTETLAGVVSKPGAEKSEPEAGQGEQDAEQGEQEAEQEPAPEAKQEPEKEAPSGSKTARAPQQRAPRPTSKEGVRG